jgi:hypothetical protein
VFGVDSKSKGIDVPAKTIKIYRALKKLKR